MVLKKNINDKLAGLSRAIAENDFISCDSSPEQILQILSYFREQSFMLIDIFAVDYPSKKKRINLVYILLSIKLNKRAQIKINLDPITDFPPSAFEVFKSANWFEREVFDMYGVHFIDHPYLERILTDYGFDGHPMLKDFPLTGYKEVRYDLEAKEVVYEDVNLPQEYRSFDFLTPWEGTKYVDEIMGKKNNN